MSEGSECGGGNRIAHHLGVRVFRMVGGFDIIGQTRWRVFQSPFGLVNLSVDDYHRKAVRMDSVEYAKQLDSTIAPPQMRIRK